jgi:hypothetical protein
MANAGHDSSASRHRQVSFSGTFFSFADATLPFILNISGQISVQIASPTQRFLSTCTLMRHSLFQRTLLPRLRSILENNGTCRARFRGIEADFSQGVRHYADPRVCRAVIHEKYFGADFNAGPGSQA